MNEHKNGAAIPLTEDAWIEREVDRLVAEEEARKRAELRMQVIDRLRCEAFEKRMAWINRPRPDLDSPPTPEEVAARHRLGDESLARMNEKLRKNDERFAAQEEARLKAGRPSGPRIQTTPGDEGFRIR
jgi:hypothetical protein